MPIKNILFSKGFILILITMAVLACLSFRVSLMARAEHAIYDQMMRFPYTQKSSHVVVVGLDPTELEPMGRWPFPRDMLADTIQWISEAGAKAVGVEFVLANREHNPWLSEIHKLQKPIDKKIGPGVQPISSTWETRLNEALIRADHDERLIETVKSAKNMVLPLEFIPSRTAQKQTTKKISRLLRIHSLASYEKPATQASSFSEIKTWLHPLYCPGTDYTGLRQPYRALAGKAGALGHINLAVSPDDTIRALPLFIPYQERWFPSLSLQLAAKFLGLSVKDLRITTSDVPANQLKFGDVDIPVDRDYHMFIRYRISTHRIPQISIVDVIDRTVDANMFRDKVVLIGPTSGTRTVQYHTPVNKDMTDTQILAHAVDTILNHDFLARPVWAVMLEMGAVLYFGLLLMLINPKTTFGTGIRILGFFLITWILAAMTLLKVMGLWLWVLPPVMVSLVGILFLRAKRMAMRIQNQSIELHRTLGLTYQSQGLLDMAFENFKQCPCEKKDIKQLLYELGQEFERKRMFSKALAVYEHILKSGVYKDLADRVQNLKSGGALVLKGRPKGPTGTMRINEATVAPTFGRYEIIHELGQGAMGTVYLGRDPKIKRAVAIKTLEYHTVLPDELNAVKSRFFHEAETAGKLSHPHIVTIYDMGEERDMAYIAMELLEGDDLTYYCKKENLLPVSKVLVLMVKVAGALAYAHEHGVIHRDIKPSNLMLIKGGQVKVTDFGIARAVDSSKTRTGVVLGTPAYMSPEQVSGKKVDGRSDLFSLGIVFYELLTGERPFSGEDMAALMYAITKGSYTSLTKQRPHLPACCVEIVDRLLTKALSRRYKNANAVATDIQKCSKNLRAYL